MQSIYQAAAKSKNNFFTVSLHHLLKRKPTFIHYHDVLELGVCLEGNGQCLTDTDSLPYKKGDTQCILPFAPHYDVTRNDNTHWLFINVDLSRLSSGNVTFSPSFIDDLLKKITHGGVFGGQSEIGLAIKKIADLIQSENQDQDLLALETVLLLKKLACETDMPASQKNILPALHLASEQIQAGLRPTPKAMADACFMSESYFRKVFTTHTGESPKQYITRMQMQRAAAKLITQTTPITEIAEICGFRDFSTFYRDFKAVYGVSPRQYREHGGTQSKK